MSRRKGVHVQVLEKLYAHTSASMNLIVYIEVSFETQVQVPPGFITVLAKLGLHVNKHLCVQHVVHQINDLRRNICFWYHMSCMFTYSYSTP